MNLLLDARTYLPHDVAGPLATKIRAQITGDTKTTLPPSLVLRIPLLEKDHRNLIADVVLTQLQSTQGIPSAYVEYIRRTMRVVSSPLPKCVSFFRSFKVTEPTDSAYQDHVHSPTACNCDHLHKITRVQLVSWDFMTRSFEWVKHLPTPADPKMSAQCLKNTILPQWSRVETDALASLQKTLERIPGMQADARITLIAKLMLYIEVLYSQAKSQTNRIHKEQYVQRQKRCLPPNLILGFFDKGSTLLWASCHNLFIPAMVKSFLQSPKRFKELLRCDSPLNASLNMHMWLTGSLSRFYFPEKTSHPAPLSDDLYNELQPILQSEQCETITVLRAHD